MALSVISVCITVLVLNIHHMEPLPDIPPWVYTLLFTLRKKHHKQQKNKVEDGCIIVQPADDCKADKLSDKVLDGQMSLFADILAELRWHRSGLEKKTEEVEVQEKWKDVASILNKGLFYLFLLNFILLIIICSILWAQT